METPDITPLVDQLEDDIDDLEDVLEPLLSQALSATTQKMPVLDKAKLHVLVTYTLESMIFSYLRLHGVNAKEHPVFKELTRVKQYMEKIKALETGPEKRTMTLDKQAAGRFIKHGLAGNDKYDLERAEREAKEKAMAMLKAARLARQQQPSVPQKCPAEDETPDAAMEDGDEDEADSESEAEGAGNDTPVMVAPSPASAKKQQNGVLKKSKEEKRERRRLKQQAKRQRKAAEKKSQDNNS
ncbi:hypothetical protein AJ80_01659 [Polytolypa hystricis UAMH7299]|uniref:Exosome complex protein n=1 Tax=Polytolypa hystricis (strain UAMH7299) TaxID=1447883 RepID=A0A2B7Z0G1_POLH7|nr:hypothetical protein AJ80_01659 [Polytolypa hystricis UAMH7299]